MAEADVSMVVNAIDSGFVPVSLTSFILKHIIKFHFQS